MVSGRLKSGQFAYDLDDILNEITKRREENEQKVRADYKAENEESKNPIKEEIISQEDLNTFAWSLEG